MSTLERLEKLEETVAQMVSKVSSSDPMVQMVMNKTIGVEQTIQQLTKTLAALTEELTESGTLDSASVLRRMRKSEDNAQRNNAKQLLAQKIIEQSDVVDDVSLVAVEQKIVNTETGEVSVISEYSLVGMASPAVDPVLKTSLLGKKEGDVVKGITGEEEEELFTIKEIYALTEKDVQGEEEVQETTDGVEKTNTEVSNG